MIRQDVEVVLSGDGVAQEAAAKALGVRLLVLGGSISVSEDAFSRPAQRFALHLRQPEHLFEASRNPMIAYCFGFHELSKPPLINQVIARMLAKNDITLLFPFPVPDSLSWCQYERTMLPILEHFKVKVRYVCLSQNPLHMRGRFEKESYLRLLINQSQAP